MVKYLLLLFIGFTLTLHSQQDAPKTYFSNAIENNIRKYTHKSQQAYAEDDLERADFLFDSLVKHVINGSYLDDFMVRKTNYKKIRFSKFDKPVFLMTYASWCTPGSGEIPALNEIANKYYKDIDFVVLFWDNRDKVKKAARGYSNKINVVYVDEMENTNCHIVQTMKHSLGFPTSFFMAADKKILDVRRGVLHPYDEVYALSYELNYNSFLNGISLLLNQNVDDQQVVASKKKP